MRLFVRYFLGEDIGALTVDAFAQKIEEATFVRELQVGVLREAIVKAIDG